MSSAVATSAWVNIGLALPVSSIQQLEPQSGSQKTHQSFALLKAVAVRVSSWERIANWSITIDKSLHLDTSDTIITRQLYNYNN